jgi:hypothetical protein
MVGQPPVRSTLQMDTRHAGVTAGDTHSEPGAGGWRDGTARANHRTAGVDGVYSASGIRERSRT